MHYRSFTIKIHCILFTIKMHWILQNIYYYFIHMNQIGAVIHETPRSKIKFFLFSIFSYYYNLNTPDHEYKKNKTNKLKFHKS